MIKEFNEMFINMKDKVDSEFYKIDKVVHYEKTKLKAYFIRSHSLTIDQK